jgi:hypothetical protein
MKLLNLTAASILFCKRGKPFRKTKGMGDSRE